MNKTMILAYEFVSSIPEKLEIQTLYVSIDYALAMHKCCCGCGREVVTPLSPTDWKLIYDGVSVSLLPSIGNWSFDCQSHYWIVENAVRWADKWSGEKIAAGRAPVKAWCCRFARPAESAARSPAPTGDTPPLGRDRPAPAVSRADRCSL